MLAAAFPTSRHKLIGGCGIFVAKRREKIQDRQCDRTKGPIGQTQRSSGVQGKYMVIKRLMPLFDQLRPETLPRRCMHKWKGEHAISEEARKRDDDALREGIRPPQKSEDLEQSLLDQIDRAKNAG